MEGPPELWLSTGAHRVLEEEARWATSLEACGCLIGRAGPSRWRVERAFVGTNIAPAPEHRFELDPGDVVRAEDEARAAGLELIGFWHTHRSQSAAPSAQDEEMTWGKLPALIVTSTRNRLAMRAWIRRDRSVDPWDELRIEVGELSRSAAPRASTG